MIGLVAVTAAGRGAAGRLAAAWPGETRSYPGPAAEALPRAWGECDALVCFLATGAVIRLVAPLLARQGHRPGRGLRGRGLPARDRPARRARPSRGHTARRERGRSGGTGARPPAGTAARRPAGTGARTGWPPGSPTCWGRNPCSAPRPTWPGCLAWTRWAGRWKARSPRSAGPCWTASRSGWTATPPGRCPPSRPTSASRRVPVATPVMRLTRPMRSMGLMRVGWGAPARALALAVGPGSASLMRGPRRPGTGSWSLTR